MIAIPIKTETNFAISPLFGKAKYFALVNGEEIKVFKNESKSGRVLADEFVKMGVKKVIVQEMGANPFLILNSNKIEVYFAGEERIEVNEALKKLNEKTLPQITPENMTKFLKGGQHEHKGHSH